MVNNSQPDHLFLIRSGVLGRPGEKIGVLAVWHSYQPNNELALFFLIFKFSLANALASPLKRPANKQPSSPKSKVSDPPSNFFAKILFLFVKNSIGIEKTFEVLGAIKVYK